MFNWIGKAYDAVSGAIDNTVARWVHDLVNGLYSFLHIIFGDVGKAWHDFWTGIGILRHYADEFGTAVYRALRHLFVVWIPDIIHWVERDILDPLLRALRWIEHEGAIIWHYISHPADLVELIYNDLIRKIESAAWDTAKILGRFAVALVYHNLERFLTLAEDVLDAIL